jgi:hypothetical protein
VLSAPRGFAFILAVILGAMLVPGCRPYDGPSGPSAPAAPVAAQLSATHPTIRPAADRGSMLWRLLSTRSRRSSIGRQSRWTGPGPDLPYLGLLNQLVGCSPEAEFSPTAG